MHIYLHDLVHVYVSTYAMYVSHPSQLLINMIKANSESCGPPPGNNFDLEVCKGQGHGMVPNYRACHKDHACQISMLYH